MTRAAESAIGLSLVVLGVGEERLELEPALEGLGEDWLLIGLCGPDGMINGLAGLDAEARGAVVEMQTLGELRSRPAESRPITGTDAALSLPLIDALIADVCQTAEGTTLDGWANGARALRRLSGVKAARLVLPEGSYRMARLTLDLGLAERQGALFLMLPATGAGQAEDAGPETDWSGALRSAVLSAPAVLTAVLHRFRLPYAAIESFKVGQVLPLPGVTVGSLRLEGPDGKLQARARLGQASGLRAVRIEDPGPPSLQDVPIGGRSGVGGMPLGGGMAGGGMPGGFGALPPAGPPGTAPGIPPDTAPDTGTGFGMPMPAAGLAPMPQPMPMAMRPGAGEEEGEAAPAFAPMAAPLGMAMGGDGEAPGFAAAPMGLPDLPGIGPEPGESEES
ncbi:FliM/FliN family flagellar motor switch protein [Pseudoroseicyclus sp. CXY001]|uniref:FliM/FliN family flagellar motor switch protein n=1 Tax=Pseudoroseicyclus sp. CXY001 TaxID=3242492 RepID=UPI003570A5C8